jgi:formiminoglutamase
MTKTSITQSQKRFNESIGSLFHPHQSLKPNYIFLTSSTDVGVVRNGGRNGARFAPKSFLSTFKKFTLTEKLKEYSMTSFEVSDNLEEMLDFEKAQKKETEKIFTILNDYPDSTICHIGGGHDHIYPLLKAISPQFKKIIILNIDAHADTRVDLRPHSGTPFRQFSHEYKGEYFIFQLGLNNFANSTSTLGPLEHGESTILWRDDLSTLSLNRLFEKIHLIVDQQTAVVFSLDADALTASEVPGVSAVNPIGINQEKLLEIWLFYKKLPFVHKPLIGIYELNPLYDSLAGLSMRTIGSFIYKTL